MGFDDGFKHGVRRVFKEAREIGVVGMDQLDLVEFINKEDYLQGAKRYAYDRLFKVISKNEKLQPVYKIIDRFQAFSEKKKRRFAKISRKNVIKMIG